MGAREKKKSFTAFISKMQGYFAGKRGAVRGRTLTGAGAVSENLSFPSGGFPVNVRRQPEKSITLSPPPIFFFFFKSISDRLQTVSERLRASLALRVHAEWRGKAAIYGDASDSVKGPTTNGGARGGGQSARLSVCEGPPPLPLVVLFTLSVDSALNKTTV